MIHFKDIKIRKKILILVFTLVGLMGVITLVSYFGMENLNKQTHIIIDHAEEVETAGNLQTEINTLAMPVNDYLITSDLKGNRDDYQTHMKNITAILDKIKKNGGMQKKERDLLAHLDTDLKEMNADSHKIFGINARDIQVNKLGASLMNELDRKAETLSKDTEGLHKIISEDIKAAEQKAEQVKTSVLVMLVIVSLASAGLGIFIGLFIARNISSAVLRVQEVTDRMAAGDLTDRVHLDQEDEIGAMARSLNKSMDGMENLVSEIIVSMQMLNRAVEEISSGNQNLSQRSSEQASSIEEIASTIEQAAATINQNSSNSQDANSMSIESLQMIEEGNRIVAQSVESINEISTYSHKIGEIIAVINEIAFQTNLLALNAAVEAARAGEQGRGFAVVAGEVRNLAQRAGNASKEIEALIKTSIEKVTMGTELSNKSGEALDRVVTSFEKLGRVVSEIAAASEEQRQGMDQINTAITELDSMTQQNAALVEETASASEEMGNQAQELLAMTEQFKVRSDVKDTVEKKNTRKSIELNHRHAASADAHGGNGKAKAGQIGGTPAGGSNDSRLSNILEQEGFEQF